MRSFLLATMTNVMVVLAIAAMLLELISLNFRALSLGFRFLANLSAGHVLGDLCLSSRYSTSLGLYQLTLLHLLYEHAVVLIQVTAFGSLVLVYAEIGV